MLYSRKDLLEIIETLPKHLRTTLIAIAWHASRFNPNQINQDRYGLCQILHSQAQSIGFTGQPEELLEPRVNLELTARYLDEHGLVEFAGYHLAHKLVSIASLAQWLEHHQSESSTGNEASTARAGVSAHPTNRQPTGLSLPRYVL